MAVVKCIEYRKGFFQFQKVCTKLVSVIKTCSNATTLLLQLPEVNNNISSYCEQEDDENKCDLHGQTKSVL